MKNCCVSTCTTVWNPYGEISLFSFPWKNDALIREWIKIVPTNRKITANSRICSLHFHNESVEQKCGKRILKKDAIPTIFAVQERTEQDSSSRLTFTATGRDKENEVVGNHSRSFGEVEDSSCLSPFRPTSPMTDRNEENAVVGNHSCLLHEVEMKSIDTQVSPHRLKPSTREEELQRKVKILQCQLRRREKRLLTMSRLIQELKQSGTGSDALEEILTSKYSGFNLDLFRYQAKTSASEKTKRSYSDKMKEFASTVYFFSLKAYAYIRKQLVALPHESTLRKWVAEYSCKPGFVSGVFEYCSEIYGKVSM